MSEQGSFNAEATKQRLASVNSSLSCADFVDFLRESLAAEPGAWENPTLERFLEAMAAYLRVMDEIQSNLGKPAHGLPTWQTFAGVLYAAKVYE